MHKAGLGRLVPLTNLSSMRRSCETTTPGIYKRTHRVRPLEAFCTRRPLSYAIPQRVRLNLLNCAQNRRCCMPDFGVHTRTQRKQKSSNKMACMQYEAGDIDHPFHLRTQPSSRSQRSAAAGEDVDEAEPFRCAELLEVDVREGKGHSKKNSTITERIENPAAPGCPKAGDLSRRGFSWRRSTIAEEQQGR